MRVARSVGVVAAATGLLWSARRSRAGQVSPGEERVFRAFNDRPDWLALPVWPVMQMGSLGAVFVAAEATRRRVGRGDALALAAVGAGVWIGVKLVKPLVGRGRPAAHLPHVHVRGHEQTGLGYPSGHAAVSLTLAAAASRDPSERRLLLAGAAITGMARMYVGAHLPLDVVGGFAAGWLVTEAAGCSKVRRV